MKYGLARLILGSSTFVEISEEKYRQIKSAKSNLFEALFIEEKLDVVIDNYLELETDLLESTARQMVLRNQDYNWYQTERNLISRRLVNLLSACRSYLDQTKHHLTNIFGSESDPVAEIEKYTNQQYDQYLGYRVMEALRNFVQHRGFPIHTVTYHSKWVRSESRENMLFSLTPYIRPEDLGEDRKFKKAVLKELKIVGDKIDIKPLIREYVASLGNIHEKIRGILGAQILEWEETILGAIDYFLKEQHEEPSELGLAAVTRNDDGTYSQPVELFKDFIEYRRQLEKKNSNLGTLAKRYVTSEVIESDT